MMMNKHTKDISDVPSVSNVPSRFARITTRHSFDLSTGKALHSPVRYRLYPKYYFRDVIDNTPELFIMIHGLRNDERGASEKLKIAQNMLHRLRGDNDSYHVVGFSYDSNTKGAHIARYQKQALAVGRRIAKANGKHLALFLLDYKKNNKNTKVRLLGHSLGTEVIHHTMMYLANLKRHLACNIIESAHFFGSSLPNDIQHDKKVRDAIVHCVRGKLVNYCAPDDDVLAYATSQKIIVGASPLGLCGAASGPTAIKYKQIKIHPENHRFASYAAALESFP